MNTNSSRIVASPVAKDENEADLYDEEEKEEVKLEDLDPQTQFFYHCRRGDVEAIKSLSSQIQDINAVDREPSKSIGYSSQNTALHYAVESGSLQAVKVVFDLEAQVDRGNKLQSTPLHLASALGYTEIVAYLLQMKADTAATNKIGNTPLHCAVYAGHTDTVKLLLDTEDDPQKALLLPQNGIGFGAVKYTAHDQLKTYLKQFFPKRTEQDGHDAHSLDKHDAPPEYNAPSAVSYGNDVEEVEEEEVSVNETTGLTGSGRSHAIENST